ncbi:Neutral lipase [Operophtera brumata]|uniref:Neutral lipase n=1 Tax=Operophtera brumata TaxID=104452 RepID=A0A0L7LP14_OPEBR|nr:Neutral lipase [Operophtera brumata]
MKGPLAILLLATAVPVETPTEYSLKHDYPRFIKFPDGEGKMHDVDLEAEPDMKLSNFNANVPTIVIVHGWLSNRYTDPNPTVRKAYLDKSDVNVITVDWSRLALSDYATAALGIPAIGRGIGQFLRFLNSVTGAAYSNMHLVGFSLGAHAVGNAGRELGGSVARVTALDPAGPMWNYNSNRVNPNDGVYVEAIHTDGGYTVGGLGIGSAVANADFFPNGGISQPGCLTNLCNHNRAWELFASTVTSNHLVGQQCTSTLQITWNTCRGTSFQLECTDWTPAEDTPYIASAVPVQQSAMTRDPYPRFIQFPDGDGNMHDVDLESEPDMEVLNETLVMNDANSIRNSNFNANVPTVVIVHGWLSNQNTDINPVIRDAYLGKSDVNVIVLDWRRLAISNYVTAANGVPAVGRGLGQFLAFVSSVNGARLDSIHLVGFSLGAHLVGNAGRELGGRVARVTGLDPAGPLWNYNRDRLNENDGVYVEAIHTDGGYTVGGLGIGTVVANADFFPNGGISQPACLTNICNHNRAWELFAATVSYNHLIGNLCTSNLQITFNNCRGEALHMGNDNLRKWG